MEAAWHIVELTVALRKFKTESHIIRKEETFYMKNIISSLDKIVKQLQIEK